MDFELKLDKPATNMACIEGIVMGVSYFVGKLSKVYVLPCTATLMTWRTGGLLPMIPYFAFRHRVDYALFTSIGVTAATPRVRVRQGTGHRMQTPGCRVECSADPSRRRSGSWRILWHCKRCQQCSNWVISQPWC